MSDERTEYEITITDAVQPGSETVRLGIHGQPLDFQRSMGRKEVKDKLTHSASLGADLALQLARDGYKLKPCPIEAMSKDGSEAMKVAEAAAKKAAKAEAAANEIAGE